MAKVGSVAGPVTIPVFLTTNLGVRGSNPFGRANWLSGHSMTDLKPSVVRVLRH